jgi:hypothetical protein
MLTPRCRARPHLVGEPVLRQPHQCLGGQPDVADAVHLQQAGHEGLQPGPGQVGHVPAGDHHIPYPGCRLQVGDHGREPVVPRQAELVLADHRGRVADQIHPGAVAAVLRAGGQHLGQHLGRVAVGEALDRPHLGFVQRVPGRVRVGRPVGPPVAEYRQHVPAHRVGVERVGEAGIGRGGGPRHGVEHLRRHQHRHGGPLALVALQVGKEHLGQARPGHLAQLAHVLHAMGTLPLRRLPLGHGHTGPAGEAPPVRLDQFPAAVGVWLVGHVGYPLPYQWLPKDSLAYYNKPTELVH